MGLGSIKTKTSEVIGVGVALIALLIMSAMTAAASIATVLKASVISAAGFVEIYLLLWMVKQF